MESYCRSSAFHWSSHWQYLFFGIVQYMPCPFPLLRNINPAHLSLIPVQSLGLGSIPHDGRPLRPLLIRGIRHTMSAHRVVAQMAGKATFRDLPDTRDRGPRSCQPELALTRSCSNDVSKASARPSHSRQGGAPLPRPPVSPSHSMYRDISL